MERKIYSKPIMFMEHFTPQEYCSQCGLVIDAISSDYSGYLRVDLNNDGHYQSGERFVDINNHHTTSSTLTSWKLLDYKVYYLVRPHSNTAFQYEDQDGGWDYENGGSYGNSWSGGTYAYENSYYLVENTFSSAHGWYVISKANFENASYHKNRS